MNSSLHYLDVVRNAWLLVGLVLIAAAAAAIGLRLLARARRAADQLEAALLAAKARLVSAEAALEQRSAVDPLTGFIDTQAFEARLREAVARCDAPVGSLAHRPQWLAVLRIGVDGWRLINDSLGHDVGARLLKEMAQRLVPLLSESDVAARVGSDEFLVLIEEPAQPCLDGSRAVAQTIAALSKPLRLADGTAPVTVSIGVSVYPDHGPIDKLLARADAAMQRARRAGGAPWKVFEANMDDDACDQLALRNDLRSAIERGQLELAYQPKVDAQRGKVTGVEALLRWNHPQHGVVGPALFVPLAERFGLIGAIGQWVVDEACRQMQVWAEQGLRLRVAINVSAHQLRDGGLAERIEAALARHEVAASQLICEITESAAMDDLDATNRTLEALGRIGVALSIDDFGTGHSSLARLRELRVSQIKLDASFVRDLESSADARAVVDAVVRLAHSLRLGVVAEGVETEIQAVLLRELQCDELQGFLLARPMNAHSLVDWLAVRADLEANDFRPSLV